MTNRIVDGNGSATNDDGTNQTIDAVSWKFAPINWALSLDLRADAVFVMRLSTVLSIQNRLNVKKQTLDDAYAVPANFLEIDVVNPMTTITAGKKRYTDYEVRMRVSVLCELILISAVDFIAFITQSKDDDNDDRFCLFSIEANCARCNTTSV